MSDYANLVNLLRDPGVDTLIDRIAAAVAAIEALVRERDDAKAALTAAEQDRDHWRREHKTLEGDFQRTVVHVKTAIAQRDELQAALAAEEKAHEQTMVDTWCDACCGTGKVGVGECMCGGTGRARDAVTYLRGQVIDTRAALARADALLRRIERVMTNRLDMMTATGEDFSEADVKWWRDTLAAYLRDREGGAA